jgi:AraC-like DNA-binding protein
MDNLVLLHSAEKHLFPEESGDHMFRLERHKKIKNSVFYHYHSQYELNMVESTGIERIVGDSSRSISGRDVVLISPNLPHRWTIDIENGLPAEADFWVLAFSRESLGLDFLSRPEAAELNVFLQQSFRGYAFSSAAVEKVSIMIKGLNKKHGLARIRDFFDILQVLVHDEEKLPLISSEYVSSGTEGEYRLIADILDRYSPVERDDIDNSPSLNEAAAFAGMSVSTFTRFFRRMTGQSFISYLMNLQIHYACSLLKCTGESITEISRRSGFSNISHFNRQFKKHTGMQPREFRKGE